MAYYLQMNGTSDYLKTPTITYTKVLLHIKTGTLPAAYQYLFWDSASSYVRRDSAGTDRFSVPTLIVNGTNAVSGTSTLLASNADLNIEVDNAARSGIQTFFANGSGNTGFPANAYDIKLYNGSTLVAWYDMTLGNVNDQSGNGNNATLTGGTWVSDASTTPVSGGGTLTGTGSLTATGNNNISGVAALTGSGSLSASGRNTIAGSSAMTASGSLTASGSVAISGGASLTATGSLTASGVVSILGGAIAGGATLTAVGSLTASGRVVTPKMIEYERRMAAARAGRRLTTVELIALQQLRKR